MVKTVVIMGTLDTKGPELGYIKELIEKRGHETIVIDGGILGTPPFQPDVTHEEVAEAAGTNLKEVMAFGDEGKAMAVMAEGALKIVQRLYSEGRLDGIIAIGGSMGTTLGVTAMKGLPWMMPKLMVSTLAFTPFFRPELVSKDLTIMPIVVDFWGLDDITKTVLRNAAGAIAGMVEAREKEKGPEKPVIGITTWGTAACRHVLWAKPLLEQKGYDVAIFPGIGTSFEELIQDGAIAGTLDFIACNHLTNDLCGGIARSGPIRFEAARKRGIPQVFAPAGVGMFSWTCPVESLPARYRKRKIHLHGMFVAVVKASKKEMAATGEMMAQKLNEMTGPTAMLLPTQGFFEYDKPGTIFHDPKGCKAFIEAFKRNIEPRVKVVELDMHLNDPEFAEQAVEIFEGLMKRHISSVA